MNHSSQNKSNACGRCGRGVIQPPGWLKTYALDEPKKLVVRLEIEAREKYKQACAEFVNEKLIADAKAAAAASDLKDKVKAQKKGPKKGAENEKPVTDDDLKDLAQEAQVQSSLTKPTLPRIVVND